MNQRIKEAIKSFIPLKILEIEPQIKLVGLFEFYIKRYKKLEKLKRDKQLKKELKKIDNINVIFAIKNRLDYKLYNFLDSIKFQTYPKKLIKITAVDYGSTKKISKKLREVCKKYDVRYLYVNTNSWNISHALNIGIKESSEKFILIAQPDIIFEKNYIEESIYELKKDPFQIILNQKRMLPKNHPNLTKDNYKKLKSISKLKQRNPYHQSMQLTLTYFFKKIKGFDETIKYMYCEDDDLTKRFILMGLKIRPLYKKASYLHQWHPQFQGSNKKDFERIEKQIKQNRIILKNRKTIIRNIKGWGKIK